MKKTILSLATVAMGLIGSQAMATTITTINDAIPVGQNVTINNISSFAPANTIAGQNVFTLDAVSKALNGGVGTIYAWCIDLFHTISPGNNTYSFTEGTLQGGFTTDNATPTQHTLNAATVSKMAGLMEIGNGVLQFGGLSGANAHYGIVGGTLDEWSAAIQLAVWQTEYDPNYPDLNWSGGDANTRIIYNDLVADASITGSASDLLALGGQQSFGYATAEINLTGLPVPEPASLAILSSALVGLGLLGRRRNRRNTAV